MTFRQPEAGGDHLPDPEISEAVGWREKGSEPARPGGFAVNSRKLRNGE